MNEKIYLVVVDGHKQTLWFGSLEKASSYIETYSKGGKCSIHEYNLASSADIKPKPLYKPLW